MDENIKHLLEEKIWYIATSKNDIPTLIPVGFKCISDEGLLLIADVKMEVTKDNILSNGNIQIAVSDFKKNISIGIRGTAVYKTCGKELDLLNKEGIEKGYPYKAKGVIIVTPSTIFSNF